MKLSLFTAISSPGLRSSDSTRPGTGRYTVCLPVVLMTRAFCLTSFVSFLPYRYTLKPEPSCSPPSSSSGSKISPTLATIWGSWVFNFNFSLFSLSLLSKSAVYLLKLVNSFFSLLRFASISRIYAPSYSSVILSTSAIGYSKLFG